MNIHQNAQLTPRGRAILVSRLDRGEHPVDVATAMGVSIRTVYKWRHRYRTEGIAGLQDRSSCPKASPMKTPDTVEATVIALRRERRIYHRIAAETGVSKSTVGRILVSYDRKLVTVLSGGVFNLLDTVLERDSFDEFGELV